MPHILEEQNFFGVDGTKAVSLAVPAGGSVTVINTGNTPYYGSTPAVTSASNDGSVASAASAEFTSTKYLICAQGAATNVFAKVNETVRTSDLYVSDDVTITDSVTQSGSTPIAVPNWQPVAATSGTDTTPADGTLFLTSLYLPKSQTLTGVGYLLGTVGGTDRVVVNLWSTAGVNLAQSTVASNGTVAGTTATYQEIAFATAYAAQGPGRYFVGVAAKGNTCRIRTVPAAAGPGLLAGSVSQTHAATTAITVPSTFTADKAPVLYVY